MKFDLTQNYTNAVEPVAGLNKESLDVILCKIDQEVVIRGLEKTSEKVAKILMSKQMETNLLNDARIVMNFRHDAHGMIPAIMGIPYFISPLPLPGGAILCNDANEPLYSISPDGTVRKIQRPKEYFKPNFFLGE